MLFDPATFPGGVARSKPPAKQAALQLLSVPTMYSDVRWYDGPPPPLPAVRGAKLDGLRYERRVCDVLAAIYEGAFRRSPVIHYSRLGAPRRAVLDGLLRLDGPTGPELLIIEVKLAHTVEVWDQLMIRYLSLVKLLEPRSRIRTIEVCRSYDPSVDIPHSVIDSLHRPGTGLEVLRWKI